MIIAIWIFALLLLGIWSLAAWGFAALLSTDGRWVAEIGPWLGRVPFADVLEAWFPTWQQSAQQMLELLQSLLQWLGNAGPVLVWALWFFGALAMLVLAGALSLLVALLRRNMPQPVVAAPPAAPQA